MRRRTTALGPCLTLTCFFLVTSLPGRAVAEVAIVGPPLRIEATSEHGSGVFMVELGDLVWTASNQTATYSRSSPLEISDAGSGQVIATLTSLTLRFIRGSRVDVNVSCRAASADLIISFRSGSLAFDTISSAAAEAKASATVSLADTDGDGAVLFGIGPPGTGIHQSFINHESGVSARFSTLLGMVAVGSGGAGSVYQTDPPSGYRAVGASVSDMSVVVAFALTANDIATLSSLYAILPLPDDVALDSDGDGRPDLIDGCPTDPAKLEPGICGCDVPELDTDEDGFPDCIDNCPTVPNPDQADFDGDGVGDACDHATGPVDPVPPGGGNVNADGG
jgi:hypothetical protein